MARVQLIEKYADILKLMADAGEEGDTNVLLDKLIYMGRKMTGEAVAEGDIYKGIPDDFDYAALMEDVKALG